jgi:tRNA-specific 2-thiouridylase
VVRLDAALNRVVVAPRQEAARSGCHVQALNWSPWHPRNNRSRWRCRSATAASLKWHG